MFDLQNLFMNILSMSTIASVVFFMILFVRKVLKNRISPEKLSLLWIVFIITLLFPINFSSRLSIKNYIHYEEKKFIDISKTAGVKENTDLSMTENSRAENEVEKVDYMKILSIVWILFAVGSISKDMILYNTLIDSKSNRKVPNNVCEILQSCKANLKIKKDIKLVIQDKIKTPSLHGILDTKILLTEDILTLSEKELECIIIHELNHYRRGHNIFYLLLKILERVYWFNPVIFFAGKLIREDLEILTDSLVINDGIGEKDYCKTILKVAEISSLSPCLMPSICSEKKELERRILQMKNKVVDSKYAFVCIVLVLAMVSLVTISLASNRVESEDEYNLFLYSGDMQTEDDIKLVKNEDDAKIDKIVDVNATVHENKIESIVLEVKELVVPLKDVKVTAKFGKRVHPVTGEEIFHSGVDVVSSAGDEVVAVADGKVILSEFDSEHGNHIKIEHEDGTVSHYAHASEVFVEVGDNVNAGEKIMLVGSTGMATGPHLHFEMQNADGEYIDVNSLFE